jgi:hypothetical protein
MQTNVLIKEECILKNKHTLCPSKKLSVFYNSCLKTFRSHLVYQLLFIQILPPDDEQEAFSKHVEVIYQNKGK